MKLLFVHDHPFHEDSDNNTYTSGSFPQSVWKNYLLNFRTVTVFGRKSTSGKTKNGLTSGLPGVSFFLTENYSSITSLFQNNFKLRSELRSLINDSDIVLARLPSVLGFIAIFEATKLNKPVWVEQVGNAKEALGAHGSLPGKIGANLFEYINKTLIKKASFVSYVTKEKLQKDYPVDEGTISVSLSDVLIEKILLPTDISKERFYGSQLKIGLIGSFDTRYKGQDILLKAISTLPKDIINKIELNFIGKGDFSWILDIATEYGLRDNIAFIGPLEAGEEMNNFLAKISLYVQPSLTEGMPRATIEAMAMGCPIIGSRVGGIPDIVNPIFLHEKHNYKELGRNILILFKNRDLLYEEAILSLKKSQSYHISTLNKKRTDFYKRMNSYFTESS